MENWYVTGLSHLRFEACVFLVLLDFFWGGMGEEVKNYLKKHQCLDCCGCLEIKYIYCIYINRNHYFYSMQGWTFHFVSLILQTAVAVVIRFERNHPCILIHGSRSNDVPIYIYHKSMYYIICLHLPETNQPNKSVIYQSHGSSTGFWMKLAHHPREMGKPSPYVRS